MKKSTNSIHQLPLNTTLQLPLSTTLLKCEQLQCSHQWRFHQPVGTVGDYIVLVDMSMRMISGRILHVSQTSPYVMDYRVQDERIGLERNILGLKHPDENALPTDIDGIQPFIIIKGPTYKQEEARTLLRSLVSDDLNVRPNKKEGFLRQFNWGIDVKRLNRTLLKQVRTNKFLIDELDTDKEFTALFTEIDKFNSEITIAEDKIKTGQIPINELQTMLNQRKTILLKIDDMINRCIGIVHDYEKDKTKAKLAEDAKMALNTVINFRQDLHDVTNVLFSNGSYDLLERAINLLPDNSQINLTVRSTNNMEEVAMDITPCVIPQQQEQEEDDPYDKTEISIMIQNAMTDLDNFQKACEAAKMLQQASHSKPRDVPKTVAEAQSCSWQILNDSFKLLSLQNESQQSKDEKMNSLIHDLGNTTIPDNTTNESRSDKYINGLNGRFHQLEEALEDNERMLRKKDDEIKSLLEARNREKKHREELESGIAKKEASITSTMEKQSLNPGMTEKLSQAILEMSKKIFEDKDKETQRKLTELQRQMNLQSAQIQEEDERTSKGASRTGTFGVSSRDAQSTPWQWDDGAMLIDREDTHCAKIENPNSSVRHRVDFDTPSNICHSTPKTSRREPIRKTPWPSASRARYPSSSESSSSGTDDGWMPRGDLPPPRTSGGSISNRETGKLAALLSKAEYLIDRVRRNMIIPDAEIKELSTDTIKTMLKSNFKEYNDAINDIAEHRFKIIGFGRYGHQRELAESLISHLTVVGADLDSCVKKIKQVARAGNITTSNTQVKWEKENIPKFNGEPGQDNPHFYQYVRQMKSFLESNNIAYADAKPIWKQSLTGEALRHINRIFPCDANPDVNVLCKALKAKFGNGKTIGNSLQKELTSQRQITALVEGSQANTQRDCDKILKTIQKIRILEAEDPESYRGTVCDFMERDMRKLLPIEDLRRFDGKRDEGISVIDAFEDVVKGIMLLASERVEDERLENLGERRDSNQRGNKQTQKRRNNEKRKQKRNYNEQSGQSNIFTMNEISDAEAAMSPQNGKPHLKKTRQSHVAPNTRARDEAGMGWNKDHRPKGRDHAGQSGNAKQEYRTRDSGDQGSRRSQGFDKQRGKGSIKSFDRRQQVGGGAKELTEDVRFQESRGQGSREMKPYVFTFVRKQDTGKKCLVCLRSGDGDKDKHGFHNFTNRDIPTLDSCPIIIHLPVEQKVDLISKLDICTKCGRQPRSSIHDEKDCNFAFNYKSLACAVDGCAYRRELCVKHIKENMPAFKRQKEQFISDGFENYNFFAQSRPFGKVSRGRRCVTKKHLYCHAAISEGRPFIYKNVAEMVSSVTSTGTPPIVWEPEGPSFFIFMHVTGADGRPRVLTFDSCSNRSVFAKDVVGRGFHAVYIKRPDREYVNGIGGIVRVSNVATLIPVMTDEGPTYHLIESQVLRTDLLSNPHEDLESEAECIKKEYIKQGGGFEPNTMIDYVLEDEQCDMLLGIKNYNLFPKPIFEFDGLHLFKCRIISPFMNKAGYTYCIGGTRSAMKQCSERYGSINMLQSVRFDKDPEFYPTIRELPVLQQQQTGARDCEEEEGLYATGNAQRTNWNRPRQRHQPPILRCERRRMNNHTEVCGRVSTVLNPAVTTEPEHASRQQRVLWETEADIGEHSSQERSPENEPELSKDCSEFEGSARDEQCKASQGVKEAKFIEHEPEELGRLDPIEETDESEGHGDNVDRFEQADDEEPVENSSDGLRPNLAEDEYSDDEEEGEDHPFDPSAFSEMSITELTARLVSTKMLEDEAIFNLLMDAVNHSMREAVDKNRVTALLESAIQVGKLPDSYAAEVKDCDMTPSELSHKWNENGVPICLKCDKECPRSHAIPTALLSRMGIPMDDTRGYYVTKGVQGQFKLTIEGINEALGGVIAEKVARGPCCIDCRKCRQSLSLTENSIKAFQEDASFEGCVTIDPDTNKLIARLPLPENYRDLLCSNQMNVDNRLRKEMKKLSPNPLSQEDVRAEIKKYLERGYIKPLEDLTQIERETYEKEAMKHWIANSIAYKGNSVSTKARICSDGSMLTNGTCLNKLLPVGSLNYNLPACIQAFLTYPVVQAGDLKSFYCSFYIPIDQFHVHQMRWIDDLDPGGKPKTYVMVRLFFGLASVPKLTLIGFEELAELYPELAEILRKAFYVDDCILGSFSKEEADATRAKLTECLKKHGLIFKGWSFSSRGADEAVLDEEGLTGFLGLLWDSKTDEFGLRIPRYFVAKKVKGQIENLEYFTGNTVAELKDFLNNEITLRKVLARAMSYFDPTGCISPFIARFRNLVRTSTIVALSQWDTILPVEILEEFCCLVIEAERIRDFRYPRSMHIANPKVRLYDLMCFSDAGEKGKTGVMYTYNDQIPSFAGGKTILPHRAHSIAKGELDAAYQVSLMVEGLHRHLAPHAGTKYLFLDATIAIHWIANSEHPLHVFQRIRVMQIVKSFTDEKGVLQVYHVRRDHNPADEGTHGKTTPEGVSPNSMYFRGPAFLRDMRLEDAVEKGIITPIGAIAKKPKTKAEAQHYADGVINKVRAFSSEVEEMEANFKLMNKGCPTSLLTGSPHKLAVTAKLFKAGKYLHVPFRTGFLTYVSAHRVAFRFMLLVLKGIDLRRRIGRTFGGSGVGLRVLNHLKEMTQFPIGFGESIAVKFRRYQKQTSTHSLLCDVYRILRKGARHLKEIELPEEKRLQAQEDLAKWKEMARGQEYILAEDESEEQMSDSTRVLQDLREKATDLTDKMACQVEDEPRHIYYTWLTKRKKIRSLAKRNCTTKGKGKQRGSWRLYPGFDHHHKAILKLREEIPWYLSRKNPGHFVSLAIAARIVNAMKYCMAYVKEPFPETGARLLGNDLADLLEEIPSDRLEDIFGTMRKVRPELHAYLDENTEQSIREMVMWMMAGPLEVNKTEFCRIFDGRAGKDYYEPRILLPIIYHSPAEYAELQALTFSLFHRILSREARSEWSSEKLAKYCIGHKGLLFSSSRVRAGHEHADLVAQRLREEGQTIQMIQRRFPALVPVGDPDSPLVIMFSIYLHYHGNYNPFRRAKIVAHQGTHMCRARLLQAVFVPGAQSRFEAIHRACSMCRVRLHRYYRSIIGPMHSSRYFIAPFSQVMFDAYGPLKCNIFGIDRETRQTKPHDVYVMVFVCMSTKLTYATQVHDQSAASMALALTRLACDPRQMPVILYADQHQSNVHLLKKMSFHVQVNDILVRNQQPAYQLLPVGNHHQGGLAERRMKELKKMIGVNDMTKVPMGTIEFETMLMQFCELINNTPLGVTHSSADGIMEVLTPQRLAGHFKDNKLLSPISVPMDVHGMLEKYKGVWKAALTLYETCVVPELLKNKRWYKDEGVEPQVGDIVAFDKRTESNFLPGWSKARVIAIKPGDDGRTREALIEYVVTPEKEKFKKINGVKVPVTKVEQTSRDADSLIVLFPVTETLDEDLARLHYDLLQMDNNQILHSIEKAEPENPTGGEMAPISLLLESTPASCRNCDLEEGDCPSCQLGKEAVKYEDYILKAARWEIWIRIAPDLMNEKIRVIEDRNLAVYDLLKKVIALGGEVVGGEIETDYDDDDELPVLPENVKLMRDNGEILSEFNLFHREITQEIGKGRAREAMNRDQRREDERFTYGPRLTPTKKLRNFIKPQLEELPKETPYTFRWEDIPETVKTWEPEPGCHKMCCCKAHCQLMQHEILEEVGEEGQHWNNEEK